MRIASWNLNHRVGLTRFRPEAADAAIALDVDAIFFNEYFPKNHGLVFRRRLADAGWCHQLTSAEPPERANRTLVAARVPVELDPLALPKFDHQLPANLLVVRFPIAKLRVIAVRVPAYVSGGDLIIQSWDWLEWAAAALVGDAAVIVGDLNISSRSPRARGGDHFRRIRSAGWSLATPEGEPSYFSATGRTSTLDYLLHTRAVRALNASVVTKAGGYILAGSPGALSDHAAIVANLQA
jgi:hypothetical protein